MHRLPVDPLGSTNSRVGQINHYNRASYHWSGPVTVGQTATAERKNVLRVHWNFFIIHSFSTLLSTTTMRNITCLLRRTYVHIHVQQQLFPYWQTICGRPYALPGPCCPSNHRESWSSISKITANSLPGTKLTLSLSSITNSWFRNKLIGCTKN